METDIEREAMVRLFLSKYKIVYLAERLGPDEAQWWTFKAL